MRRTIQFITVLFFCMATKGFAQDKFVLNYQFALSKGFNQTFVHESRATQNIDFLNYIDRFPLLLEDAYTGISTHLWIRNSIEINAQALINHNISLKNISFSIMRISPKHFGYNFGFTRYEQVITGIYGFPFTGNDTSFYLLSNTKAKYRFSDWLVYAGFVYRKSAGRLQLDVKLSFGACLFTPFTASLLLKQKNNNLVQKIDYQTVDDWYGLIMSEVRLGYDIMRKEKFNLGVECKANLIFENRPLDYTKTTYSWTKDNYVQERINPDNHLYYRYEVDMGVFLKF